MPSRHGRASSLRGWRWRDASQHQLLAGEFAVVMEDVQMMCLRPLICGSFFMLGFWMVLDGFGLNGIGLD